MNWIGDKIALLATAVVCAAGAWAILHYSGTWFFPVATVIGVLWLYRDNQRLRALLKEHGIDPKRKFSDG
jgi:membrane protease YdiL (CAAX protease family)